MSLSLAAPAMPMIEDKSGAAPGHQRAAFLRDCLAGLSATPKRLPCKWLYDDCGSQLFEEICRQPEYYPARAEEALLRSVVPAIGDRLAPGTTLVELGSGASRKTRILLDAAPAISVYIPVDISADELDRAAASIRHDYFGLDVCPVQGDFTEPDTLNFGASAGPLLLFFPGSTLGNFAPAQAKALLADLRWTAGPSARLLIGVDLAKDENVLAPAYDDAAGITAAFNLNLLARMRRELGCEVDESGFAHQALWNAADSRMEMHLVSRGQQVLHIGPHAFALGAGETIHTESSYKLTRSAWLALSADAGWRVEESWCSPAPAVMLALMSA